MHSNAFGEAEAIAVFDKSKSWTKDTTKFDYKTELKLQKLMFNLTELYARKINNKIKALKYANNDNGLDFKILEKEYLNRIDDYNNRCKEIREEKGKTKIEIINYWTPIINELLKKEE